ncbi:Thioredoxin domain-containing protein [Tenacibaculum litopenaei]|uniref:thioredoxin family protein n=1 Tax=Tenacibaculum litopenaei TaxID=396016 RepID=UPI003895F76F
MKINIKILHASCCARNSFIKNQLERLANEHDLSVHIEEFSEMQDTLIYGTTEFPALVIDQKVYPYKHYQSDTDLTTLLKAS